MCIVYVTLGCLCNLFIVSFIIMELCKIYYPKLVYYILSLN